MRSSTVCFFRELLTYADHESRRDYDVVQLDMPGPLLSLPKRVDHWFEEAPRTVESSGQSATVERRTVRAWSCSTKPPR